MTNEGVMKGDIFLYGYDAQYSLYMIYIHIYMKTLLHAESGTFYIFGSNNNMFAITKPTRRRSATEAPASS